MSYYSCADEIERKIKQSLEIGEINYIPGMIDNTIKELEKVKSLIPDRIEFIKKNITKRYIISVWKHKGEYQDTTEDFKHDYTTSKVGVYYAVTVFKYYFDNGKEIQSEGGYDYDLSLKFSPPKKKMCIEYAFELAKKYNVDLIPADKDPNCVNDNCLYTTIRNWVTKSRWE